MNRLRELGAVGLTHQARGKPSNNRYSSDYRDTVLKLIRDHYSDFSPTLVREKLSEHHNLIVSKETLRQWMIADGLWVPHSKEYIDLAIDGTVSVNSFRLMARTMIGLKAANTYPV